MSDFTEMIGRVDAAHDAVEGSSAALSCRDHLLDGDEDVLGRIEDALSDVHGAVC